LVNKKYNKLIENKMAKVKMHLVAERERYQMVGEFFEIVTNLKTKKNVIDFFIGIMTPSELLMIARRIQIAEMIIKEKNYDQIRKELKVSNQTITKVYGWLYDGNDGFGKEIAAQLKRKIESEKSGKRGRENYESMLNKYAHHRMLKSLLR
jgi:TrpR-related protein YerC/YecD